MGNTITNELPAKTFLRSPAKINLGLRVGPLSGDGFHPLQSLFVRVSLHDEIRVETTDRFALTCNDPSIPTDGRNLLTRAYHAYFKNLSNPPTFKIHLEKNIPWGGGVGGGSSNAAEFLKFLHRQKLCGSPSFEELLLIAKNLGSDIPFFMHSTPCYAEGRGEILTTVDPIPALPIILAGTGTPLATTKVFKIYDSTSPSELTPFPMDQAYQILTQRNGLGLEKIIQNDLQTVVEKEWPEMKRVRSLLENSGANYTSMSGSGFIYYSIYPSVQIRDYALQTLRNELPFIKGAHIL